MAPSARCLILHVTFESTIKLALEQVERGNCQGNCYHCDHHRTAPENAFSDRSFRRSFGLLRDLAGVIGAFQHCVKIECMLCGSRCDEACVCLSELVFLRGHQHAQLSGDLESIFAFRVGIRRGGDVVIDRLRSLSGCTIRLVAGAAVLRRRTRVQRLTWLADVVVSVAGNAFRGALAALRMRGSWRSRFG